MKNGMKIAAASLLILFLTASVFAQSFGRIDATGFSDFRPGPVLLYPTIDVIDITGLDSLEFKWERDASDTHHYVFKLYKGYNMYADDLILSQDIGSSEISFKVDPGRFENEQVYTWSLVQVSFTGSRSDKSSSTFKVLKK
jgi:hypothetical protein